MRKTMPHARADVPYKGHRYRHNKSGREYTVLLVAKDSETCRLSVVYSDDAGNVWHRHLFGGHDSGEAYGWMNRNEDGSFRFERIT